MINLRLQFQFVYYLVTRNRCSHKLYHLLPYLKNECQKTASRTLPKKNWEHAEYNTHPSIVPRLVVRKLKFAPRQQFLVIVKKTIPSGAHELTKLRAATLQQVILYNSEVWSPQHSLFSLLPLSPAPTSAQQEGSLTSLSPHIPPHATTIGRGD